LFSTCCEEESRKSEATFQVVDANLQQVIPAICTPPPEAFEGLIKFTISFAKSVGDVVGIDVDLVEGDKLRIVMIKEGLLSKWNIANPSSTVKTGDHIIDINGTSGDANAMHDAIVASATNIEMVILRRAPTILTISFEKNPGDIMGLHVALEETDKLRVAWVSDGLVSKWNTANPTRSVKAGDYIIDINGTICDVEAMQMVVASATQILMVISRP